MCKSACVCIYTYRHTNTGNSSFTYAIQHMYKRTHTHTRTHTHIRTHTHTHSLTLSLSLALSHSITHTHRELRQTKSSGASSMIHTHTLSHILTHAHTHTGNWRQQKAVGHWRGYDRLAPRGSPCAHQSYEPRETQRKSIARQRWRERFLSTERKIERGKDTEKASLAVHYGVAGVSRMDEIIGLFCKRAL